MTILHPTIYIITGNMGSEKNIQLNVQLGKLSIG